MKWALVNPAAMLLVLLLAVFLLPASAMGGLSANVELDYNTGRTSSEDSAGNKVTSETVDFLQRYNLDYRQPIFPTISLGAGYILEKDLVTSKTNDIHSDSEFTRTSPSADLSFRNPFVNAMVGYNQVSAKTDVQGSPAQTLIQDNVNAAFGLTRRENRPTLNINYGWSHAYDKEHALFDTVTQGFFLTSMYRPVKQLEMRYSGSYNDLLNKHGDNETESVNHIGRFNYSDDFLNRRLRVYSSYDVSFVEQKTKVFGLGTGEVTEQILPVAGLSGSGPVGTDTPPENPASDTLISNALLIDGNKSVASGVNIGFSTLVTAPRNMGLDLGVETELNSIYVWVNQSLPASISTSYSWDVYISSDITPLKQWTLLQTIASAPFGAFDARFELRFANVKTRFIKVVTRPLASPVPVPGVDINNINVTEIEANIIRPVQGVGTTTTTRGQGSRFEAGATAKLANVPNLNYDINYWETEAAFGGGGRRDTLTNRLSASQRLSRVFTADAMVTRGDAHERDGDHLNYNYTASLNATPLKTLSHSLRFTRTTDEVGEVKSESNNLYFTNNATPYRGIGVTLTLTQSDSKDYTDRRTQTEGVIAGTTLTPNRKLTINLYYNNSRTHTTRDDILIARSTTEDTSSSVAYTPVETVFLYAAYATSRLSSLSGSRPTSRSQTYTLSWLPMLGDLWFSFTASQVRTSFDQGETNTLSPQLHWNINPSMILEVGYQLVAARNYLIRSRTETFFSTLRIAL